MPIFLPLVCLMGMGVALLRRGAQADPDATAGRDDAPARLLRWAVGLLSADREEWGRAMLGELDYIDGRGRRWRFAVGCAGAALLLLPWGRAAAAVWAMVAVAAGGTGLYAAMVVRYGLGTGAWVFAAITLMLLAGYILAASVLVRRPGVTVPGLLTGLFVALAWLAPDGFTFLGVIVQVPAFWMVLVQLLAVPLLAGAAGALWGGSALAGRRIAGFAGLTSGLGLYLYATVAVAVIGAGGAGDSGWTVSATVADRLGNNGVFYLWLLPLTTAALGWAGAVATASLRPRLAATARSALVPAAGRAGQGRPRAVSLPLACAVLAAALFLAAVTMLKG